MQIELQINIHNFIFNLITEHLLELTEIIIQHKNKLVSLQSNKRKIHFSYRKQEIVIRLGY
ncbi:hypothetical protein LPYR103PRE_15240 [Segatella asaccharophila]